MEPTVDHVIETDSNEKTPLRHIFQHSPAALVVTKKNVIDLLRKEKIRRSRSSLAASLFFVRQKVNLRGAIDYQALNRITKPENTPILRPEKRFDRLGGVRLFLKQDFKSGFYQIRVAPDEIQKTDFITKYAHFELLIMPMGIRISPFTFQSVMNNILYDHINDFMVIYVDEIPIYCNLHEERLRHLRIVLHCLRHDELYVEMGKFEIISTETEFLGLRCDGWKG